ncbi:MAG TPA: isopentenyl phosphate kinase [Methanoregulaceae archaeon]|nr:isopentenyl phosphate kinase [Methanoregulaceae archaeon]
MPERMLLKIGGSVITDKAVPGSIRNDEIGRIAQVIASRPDLALLLVHGAGSCGHPEASRFHINEGVSEKNKAGIYETHRAVACLNARVVGSLREAGTEAVGVHLLSAGYANNGRLVSCEFPQVGAMIGLGIVPVLHGDVVMDLTKGASIISGDQLVSILPGPLGITRIGVATDVPGVLRHGEVVREITPESKDDLEIGTSGHTDVTGGMSGKVGELLFLAEQGICSDIFHASRIGDFLDGKPHGGTRVRGD